MSCILPLAPMPVTWPSRGVGSDSMIVIRQEFADVRGERAIDSGSATRLAGPLNEILHLQELGPNWNLDGARPIAGSAVTSAANLLRSVEESAFQQGVAWEAPEIGPVPDGGVALTWEGGTRETLMICHPGEPNAVECIHREAGGRSVRQVLPMLEAVRLALWTLDND